MRKLLTAVAALSVSACVQQPSQTATAPVTAPPSPAAASASPPSDAQVAAGRWQVARVRCSDLLRASDDDRASAAMFYYGYFAAKSNLHVIDVSEISDKVHKVMEQCAATPDMTVPTAFRHALGSHH